MSVDAVHPLYAHWAPAWRKVRDCESGERAIKAAGETYLPRTSQLQPTWDYDALVSAGQWYDTLSQSLATMLGMAMRKPHELRDEPPELTEILPDLDLRGSDLRYVIQMLTSELLNPSRVGLYVGYSDQHQRPFLSIYPAESITNWQSDEDGRVWRVVLREPGVPRAVDDEGFEVEETVQYRVVYLEDDGSAWRRVYTMPDGRGDWVPDEPVRLSLPGLGVGTLPFLCLPKYEVRRPAYEALADTQLAFYRVSAPMFRAMGLASFPTPIYRGMDEDFVRKFSWGPGQCLQVDPQEDVEILTYDPAALETNMKALADISERMSDVGARLMETRARLNETARAKELQQSAETAVLEETVEAVEGALQTAFRWMFNADVDLQLNKDFVPTKIDPQLLERLGSLVERGLFPMSGWSRQLREGELMDMSDEEFLQALSEDATRLGVVQPIAD